MTEGWQSPSIAETTEILYKINAAEPVTRYGSDCALAVMALPFYGASAFLARVSKPQPAAPAQYYAVLKDEAIALDGSIANIHAANAAAPIALDAGNVGGYLAFRLYFASAAVMLRARCEKRDNGWQATLRIQDKTGTYEVTAALSPRGELSENGKEQCSTESLDALPSFAALPP